MKPRLVVLLILISGLWALMLLRGAFLQILPNERLSGLQKKQFETSVTLYARRGDVTDRRGHELAISTSTYSVFADPKIIEQPRMAAEQLGRILGMNKAVVLAKIKDSHNSRFVWLARKIDRSHRDEIEQLKIRGIGFIEESRRIYPNEHLLAGVLGFVGSDEKGLEGLEAQYNDVLEGSARKVSMKRDARGRPLVVNGQLFHQAPDGSDLQLTIDRELQYILEQELGSVAAEQSADSAVGVILDAQTSEVLAMASAPSFDPNQPGHVPADWRRNRTVTDSYEPGSIMKTFVVAGALEQNKIEPNTKIDCEGGQMRIGNRIVREADQHHNFKSLTVSEILAFSSNVGAAKIGLQLGATEVRAELERFGFGEKTGIDSLGESRGILQSLPWREHLLANVSFGHGVATTALQIANAYAAIANGGWLKRPFLVKKIRDGESGEVTEIQPKTLKRAVTSSVATKLKLMLMGVTEKEGTGFNARVPGYPVAGKTGTAQKVNPNGRGYLHNAYISSFAGFIPANDPKFVIYIAVDNPKKDYYGAAVAAPVFSKVAKFAVRQYGLPPVLIGEKHLLSHNPGVLNVDELKAQSVLPSSATTGAPATGATATGATATGVAVRGVAETAAALPGTAKTGDDGKPKGASSPMASMPDLTGLSLREVLTLINGQKLDLRVHGHGRVVSSVPLPGQTLGEPRAAQIYLAP